ncbi:Phosphatidate cytidylyltransferase [Pandoraea terrae]|uniref:Phosphatidate cytidylyltransferase n=1 Tax=Pandoraea terrae TaxID=1537710 RepID=A0A5E4WS94_9BURK|nr:phosphatidate cytidylyltransferase [Pandoraea terrae]VVE26550.1 Phosphatidate cytidylyltransferase [Pandoraea terrae]
MLKTRVITAVVLLLILLPVIFAGTPAQFAWLAAIIVTAAGWEWARLMGMGGVGAGFYGAVSLATVALTWRSGLALSHVWLKPAALFWVLAGPYALMRRPATKGVWRALLLCAGPVVLVAAWQALCLAREHGIAFLLSVLVIVWIADTGAYFAGRTFGRRKLAPSISPGKSWEGAIGGWLLVMAAAAGVLFSGLSAPTIVSHLRDTVGLSAGILLLTLLVAFSVVGDLFESQLKRQAGVKDSSHLLPGHGGVLDRIDALLPVLPLALVFI